MLRGEARLIGRLSEGVGTLLSAGCKLPHTVIHFYVLREGGREQGRSFWLASTVKWALLGRHHPLKHRDLPAMIETVLHDTVEKVIKIVVAARYSHL